MKKIYLAGGCFWGMQKYMDQFKGVLETTVGYANSNVENPLYPEVKAQKTGASETVEVVYDETVISLKEIFDRFMVVIDPTSLNKQGEDEGTSYRTGIYSTDETEVAFAAEYLKGRQAEYDKPIVIETVALKNFYPAEEYHQKYLVKNPDGYCHIGGCFFNE